MVDLYWFEEPGYVIQTSSFASRQPIAATLYFIFIGISILIGTVGNILILGAIYVSKVYDKYMLKLQATCISSLYNKFNHSTI